MRGVGDLRFMASERLPIPELCALAGLVIHDGGAHRRIGVPLQSAGLQVRKGSDFGCARPMLLGPVALVLLSLALRADAQSYFHDFHNHNAEMKALQPTWVTPLVGTTPLLGQFVREQFVREKVAGGDTVWNVGNGKGPTFIFFKRVETDLAIPNYGVHGSVAERDGFGDFCVTARVRIASGSKESGNYSVSAVASQTWTTGQDKNGAVAWTRGITLVGGKAFGRFAALGSAGATIPADSGLATMGRPVAVNTAFEMHVKPRLWGILESNATFFKGGTHDGLMQHYMTPQVFLVPLRPWSAKSKSYVLLGLGMQFATSRFHASDHNLIVDTKIYF